MGKELMCYFVQKQPVSQVYLDLRDFLRGVSLQRVHDWQESGVCDKLMVVNSKQEEETATAKLHLPAITQPKVKKMKQTSHLRKWHHKKTLFQSTVCVRVCVREREERSHEDEIH